MEYDVGDRVWFLDRDSETQQQERYEGVIKKIQTSRGVRVYGIHVDGEDVKTFEDLALKDSTQIHLISRGKGV